MEPVGKRSRRSKKIKKTKLVKKFSIPLHVVIAVRQMWKIIFLWKKHKSASTCWLNLVDSDEVDTGCGVGRVQVLQTSQVSNILSIRSITSVG